MSIRPEVLVADAKALLVACASGDTKGAALLLNQLDRKELERVALTLCALAVSKSVTNGAI